MRTQWEISVIYHTRNKMDNKLHALVSLARPDSIASIVLACLGRAGETKLDREALEMNRIGPAGRPDWKWGFGRLRAGLLVVRPNRGQITA